MQTLRHTPYNFNQIDDTDLDLLFFLNNNLWWITSINDINLFKCAFTHSSLQKVSNISNERLEFLGDSVFGMIITEHIFQKYNTANEGVLTKVRTRLVNGHTLATISKKIGIDKLLAVSKRITQYNKRMLEDAFESFIGALYLDQGLNCCRTFILNNIDNLDCGDLMIDTNYKDILLKKVQTDKKELSYIEVDVIGPPHQRLYRMQVSINNKSYGVGCASSKKEAEQHAAKETLVILGNRMDNRLC